MKKIILEFGNVFMTAMGFLLSPMLLASFIVVAINVMTLGGNTQPLALVGVVFVILLLKDGFEAWNMRDESSIHDDVLLAVKSAGQDGITAVEIARRTSIARDDVKEALCNLLELREVAERGGKVFTA